MNVPGVHAVQVAAAPLVLPVGPTVPAVQAVPVHGPTPLVECVPGRHAAITYVTSNPVPRALPSDVNRTSSALPLDVSTVPEMLLPLSLGPSCTADLVAPSWTYTKSQQDSVLKREKRSVILAPAGTVSCHEQSVLSVYCADGA
jgi:hypothetical protein